MSSCYEKKWEYFEIEDYFILSTVKIIYRSPWENYYKQYVTSWVIAFDGLVVSI